MTRTHQFSVNEQEPLSAYPGSYAFCAICCSVVAQWLFVWKPFFEVSCTYIRCCCFTLRKLIFSRKYCHKGRVLTIEISWICGDNLFVFFSHCRVHWRWLQEWIDQYWPGSSTARVFCWQLQRCESLVSRVCSGEKPVRMTSFQSRTCLKKDASVLFTEWPDTFFFPRPGETRK